MRSDLKSSNTAGASRFSSVDDYHASWTGIIRKQLDSLRAIIQKAAPEATEIISHNMPAFKTHTNLVYYAAHTHHIGFYPTSTPMDVFASELKSFRTSKGAIQFPFDQPLPEDLIRRIVLFRIQQDEERSQKKMSSTRK